MLPLVLHLALYPLIEPAAAVLWRHAGREPQEPPPWGRLLSLAVYLAAALALAAHAFLAP